MKIHIAKEGPSYAIHVLGPLTVRIDEKVIREALDAATRSRYAGQDFESAFWEVLINGIGGAMATTEQIWQNPLVQHVMSQMPTGRESGMTAIQAADAGCQLAKRALNARAKTFEVVHAAACGNQAAIASILDVKRRAKTSPAAAEKFREVVEVAQLAADHETLHNLMMNSREVPPSYTLVYD